MIFTDIVLCVAFGTVIVWSASLGIKETIKRHKENKARKNPPTHDAGETFSYEDLLAKRKAEARADETKAALPSASETVEKQGAKEDKQPTSTQTRHR